MSDIYAALRKGFGLGKSESQVLASCARAPLLFLDDFASGVLSDFERREALDLVDKRMNSLLPSVVTTNLTLEEIARWDDRIASRLATFRLVNLEGADRRLSGQSARNPRPEQLR